jgi:hypothetical protein
MDQRAYRGRIPLRWIALGILPLMAAGAVMYLLLTAEPDAEPETGVRIPSLGSRADPLPAPTQPEEPAPEPEVAASPEEEADPEPEHESSEREIDILIGRLIQATRSGHRRSRDLAHAQLRRARPHELVDRRLAAHLPGEQSAWVRIELFAAFHDEQARRAWALQVLDQRAAQFTGAETRLAGGEVEELSLYTATLLALLFEQGAANERLLALARDAISAERPEWLLAPLLAGLTREAAARNQPGNFAADADGVLASLREPLRRMLERRSAAEARRESAFALWIMSLPQWDDALLELEQTVLRVYLPQLVRIFPPRDRTLHEHPLRDWANLRSAEIATLCSRMLDGQLDADTQRALIAALAQREFPGARAMLESGLARRDEHFAHWLIALGSMATRQTDVERLRNAANDPDVQIAQAGVEGLRLSPLHTADAELRSIIEQGANVGVRSQALGALLDRSANKARLLEEFLDHNKSDALRAVAVAHVSISDVARLQRIVEEDPAPRVRQAALTRLGELEDKSLRMWFVRISNRDPIPLIRQQARGYADALRDS